MDEKLYCSDCIHKDVCGLEGLLDEGMTFCASKKTGWIPVSERLPENGDYVLCCDKDGYMAVGRVSNWSSYWCFDDDKIDDVTAWMPLPKAYKKDGD